MRMWSEGRNPDNPSAHSHTGWNESHSSWPSPKKDVRPGPPGLSLAWPAPFLILTQLEKTEVLETKREFIVSIERQHEKKKKKKAV